MVVSSNALASAIGRDVLRRGGNAVDAAVAVGFALAVVHPSAGNIGGGGFMLVRMADGSCDAIDYRETAPAGAKRDMYLDARGEVVPNLSSRGPLSAGVPGTVAGLALARERFGTLPLAALVLPAIDLARHGFVVPYSLYRSMTDTTEVDLQADFHAFPSTARIFLRNGQPWAPGDTLRQPDLARTLEQIARRGPDAFYRGPIADLIERAMRRDGGLVTKADLTAYRPVVRKPLVSTYRGYTLYSMPPPSSGGVLLTGILHALEPDSLVALGHNSSAYMHRLAETWNRYYADRAFFLGDPDFASVPVAGLMSREYAANVRALVDPRRHVPCAEIAHGDSLWLSQFAARAEESRETTHFCVVDRWGNAVSNTYTLNYSYGSRYVIEGAGFLINDEMDDFSAKPGVPNLYGLVGGKANAIDPGKRMLSSMNPTIVTQDGKLFLVLGSPGGSRIITSLCQVLLNVIDFGMGLQDAVVAPRFHSQWLPDRLDVEPIGFPRDVLDALTARGHSVYTKYGFWSEVQAIQVDAQRGLLLGAADPRWGASATAGY
jgi:gamma-glutamyltranspeptidase/glutathione hydrolase